MALCYLVHQSKGKTSCAKYFITWPEHAHTHTHTHTQRQSSLCTVVQNRKDNYITKTVQNSLNNQWEKHFEQTKQASEPDSNITLVVELIIRQGIKNYCAEYINGSNRKIYST